LFPFRIIGEHLARLAVEFSPLLTEVLEVIAVPGPPNIEDARKTKFKGCGCVFVQLNCDRLSPLHSHALTTRALADVTLARSTTRMMSSFISALLVRILAPWGSRL
jgi:hypothetical protein